MTTCVYCKTEYTATRWAKGLYCTQTCSAKHVKEKKIEAWLAGEVKGWSGKTVQLSPFIRNYLKDTRGTACSKCGWDEYHPIDGRSLTEIDHIDGDAHNCAPSNLQIICPNCHSMTPTFRARNKNSKRQR